MTATWPLATFHTTLLALVTVVLAYRGGGLGEALSGLSTLAGFALFGVLWATTTYTTRRALRDAPVRGGMVRMGVRWGAVNGALFLWGASAILAATQPAGILFIVPIAVLGTFVALVVGAVIGALFGIVDTAAFGAVRWIVRN
ncbi:MAG TPA: hypothetical protein VFM93_11070 [Candidatus Limnocylindria bacterium]|nr:hypothetical protein [Candidatus Limnocylindria bacterium]